MEKKYEEEINSETPPQVPSPNGTSEPEEGKKAENWIQEVASQSWEPELLISGVAIYLTLGLPDFLSYAFDYYVYHIVSEADGIEYSFVNLIYGVLYAVSYGLILTFVVHFALRAFWVGLVGLFSVFPQDIQYDQLKKFSNYYRQEAKQRLGSLEGFITRLDKTCSILFSLCSLFVVMLLGITFIYLLFYILTALSKLVFSPEVFAENEAWFFFTFGLVFILFGLAVTILGNKRFHQHERLARLHFRLSWGFSNFVFPFTFRPLMYIMFTFYSHISRRKINVVGAIIGISFYIFLFYGMLRKRAPQRVFDTRSYYTAGSPYHIIEPAHYDNLRETAQSRSGVSIQSDVIKDSYLRLFISYPKRLDQNFKDFCKEAEIPDSLSKYRKRELTDQQRLACVQDYYQILINDSLYQGQEFIFHRDAHGFEEGFLSYIPAERFKSGKNVLTIKSAQPDPDDQRGYLYVIPFWYLPGE